MKQFCRSRLVLRCVTARKVSHTTPMVLAGRATTPGLDLRNREKSAKKTFFFFCSLCVSQGAQNISRGAPVGTAQRLHLLSQAPPGVAALFFYFFFFFFRSNNGVPPHRWLQNPPDFFLNDELESFLSNLVP